MRFDQFSLSLPILRALTEQGYETATPIQQRAIPEVLAGRDLLGCAQTGTGKTAAFALPILQLLSGRKPASGRPIRTLVVTPTRELAAQIAESFKAYGRHLPLTTAVIFGGVGQRPQEDALRRGVDILIATPGRLLDLMGQGYVRLGSIEVLVLDEADRMLDMGFIHDIRKILKVVPAKRQTLFFSATMPREIRSLADSILHDPVPIEVTPVATTAETVSQAVYFVAKNDKPALLQHLLTDGAVTRALVFTRTKHGADKVAKHLSRANIHAEAIHGNKSQNARIRALDNFKKGSTRVLVASDIASRGLDVDDISHVVNFDLPNEPETYVHRIGRTGRAGASGKAMSFCDGEERAFLRDIERTIRKSVPVVDDHPYRAGASAPSHQSDERRPQQQRRPQQGNRQGYGRSGDRRGDRGSDRGHGQDRRSDAGSAGHGHTQRSGEASGNGTGGGQGAVREVASPKFESRGRRGFPTRW
ncbi:MAG: DEAD/DEAH box helicase [Planctomycetes bacterium]|nr:DEAD/DEAH box helicase [Planctomycetota bacterium]